MAIKYRTLILAYTTRTQRTLRLQEQLILNETTLAEALMEYSKSDFFTVGTISPSPDDKYLAFTFDLVGQENYTTRIIPLKVSSSAAPPAREKTHG